MFTVFLKSSISLITSIVLYFFILYIDSCIIYLNHKENKNNKDLIVSILNPLIFVGVLYISFLLDTHVYFAIIYSIVEIINNSKVSEFMKEQDLEVTPFSKGFSILEIYINGSLKLISLGLLIKYEAVSSLLFLVIMSFSINLFKREVLTT